MTEKDPVIGYLGFSLQQLEAQRAGWLQSRYYSDDDSAFVRDFLSFEEVHEICPYEVGVDRRKEKREHKKLLDEIKGELRLEELLKKRFAKLSNGEMRRVLLAREILKKPDVLVLDNPLAGLDPKMRERFQEVFRYLETRGVKLKIKNARETVSKNRELRPELQSRMIGISTAKKVVEIDSITVKFGKRKLFDNFSWTIREGERWVLRGENGAGKTTLMALITGDSPLAYSLDISVFGQKREIGQSLDKIRGRIGMVGPEMQYYLGESIDTLLDKALTEKTELLLLDEPCMNLDAKKSAAVLKRIDSYLSNHPKVAAVCVAHISSHIPSGFDRLISLA